MRDMSSDSTFAPSLPGRIGTEATAGIASAAVLAVLVAGCSGNRVDEEPIIEQGDRVEVPDGTAQRGSGTATATRERREEIRATALAECEGSVCDAIVRGEVALGMSETAVLAATRTTEEAWRVRRSGPAVSMTPVSLTHPPEDAVSTLTMVRLSDGRVSAYAYQEPEGVRLVQEPSDATAEGRRRARAEALIREGDELAATGEFDAALNRYDRADLLTPGDPMIDFKIATALDKQLRPIQALIQYKLFLHRLELERIEAKGEAFAKIAEAIARARERIIVLERRTR